MIASTIIARLVGAKVSLRQEIICLPGMDQKVLGERATSKMFRVSESCSLLHIVAHLVALTSTPHAAGEVIR